MFESLDLTAIVIFLLLFSWLGTVTFLLIRILKTFNKLTQGVSEKDLKSVLDEVLKEIKKEKEVDEELLEKIEKVKLEALDSVQKVGLVRYNPFSDTGGNQSFVLALLNGKDDGLVITSLHSRESTRVFAKPVFCGKEVGFEFSKEELQAVAEAKKKPLVKK